SSLSNRGTGGELTHSGSCVHNYRRGRNQFGVAHPAGLSQRVVKNPFSPGARLAEPSSAEAGPSGGRNEGSFDASGCRGNRSGGLGRRDLPPTPCRWATGSGARTSDGERRPSGTSRAHRSRTHSWRSETIAFAT